MPTSPIASKYNLLTNNKHRENTGVYENKKCYLPSQKIQTTLNDISRDTLNLGKIKIKNSKEALCFLLFLTTISNTMAKPNTAEKENKNNHKDNHAPPARSTSYTKVANLMPNPPNNDISRRPPEVVKDYTERNHGFFSQPNARETVSQSLPATSSLCPRRLLEESPPPAALTQHAPDNVLLQSNIDIEAMLKEQSCVDPNVSLSPSQLISSAITFSTQNDQSRSALVRTIQRAKGHYGQSPNEPLSLIQQNAIIKLWVAKNVYGQDLTHFLRDKIIEHPKKYGIEASPYSAQDMKNDLRNQLSQHFKNAGHDKVMMDWIWSNVVLHELPILRFQGHLDTLTPDNMEWGQINAGLCFAQHVGHDLTTLSSQDALVFGQILLAQIQAGTMPPITYFRLPGILHDTQTHLGNKYPQTHQPGNDAEFEVNALERYLTAHTRRLEENNPVSAFTKVMENYKTRAQLAKQIIDDRCPGMEVNTYLNLAEGFCRQTPHQTPYDDPEYLENIDRKYESQIDRIATDYEILDTLLVTAALDRLNKEELEFISSATFRRAGGELSAADDINYTAARGNPAAVKGLTIGLASRVELFSAKKGNEPERIYALRHTKGQYALERVDRLEASYHKLELFEKIAKLPKTNYKLKVSPYGEPLDHNADFSTLIDNIVQQHKTQFKKDLFEYGRDQTPLDKAKKIAKSAILLHDCITEIRAGDLQEATLSCSLDALTVLPVIGGLMGSSLKASRLIGTGILRAKMTAASEFMLKHSLQQVFKSASLTFLKNTYPHLIDTTKAGIRTFLKTSLQAIDPGAELLGMAGKKTAQGIMTLGNKMTQSHSPLRKVWNKLAPSIDKLSEEVTWEFRIVSPGDGIDTKSPVTKINTPEFTSGVTTPWGKELREACDQWIKAPHGAKEQREAVVATIKECAETQNPHLDLSNRSITSLPTRLPPHITKLSLSKNQLKTLPADLPETLRFLYIAENELSTLPKLPSLLTLDVSINKLTHLDNVLPSTLRSLQVPNNQLHHLPDSLPNDLVFLDASINQLEQLPEIFPENIKQVFLIKNKLTKLPQNWPEKILTLDLRDNKLTTLNEAVARLSHHAEVLVSNNPLSLEMQQILLHPSEQSAFLNHNIKFTVPATPPLKVSHQARKHPYDTQTSDVNVGAGTSGSSVGTGNAPKRFKPDTSVDTRVPEVNSGKDSSLGVLTLPSPELMSIWQKWVAEQPILTQENRAQALTRMYMCVVNGDKHLDLSYLQLTSLPSQLPPSIKKLTLHGARFINFPTSLPTTLTTLDLQNCNFYRLPTQWPQNLDTLILAGATIDPHTLQGLPESLRTLDLSNTGIHKLPILPKGLKRLNAASCNFGSKGVQKKQLPETLEYLNLSHCGLSQVPTTYSSDLRELNLHGNHLTNIKIKAPGLEKLIIRKQQVRKTSTKTNVMFSDIDLPNLRQLDISSNHLITLPTKWPPQLQSLILENTELAEFPANLPPGLQHLDLSDNELTQLPANLPPALRNLHLQSNYLAQLPASWPSQLQNLNLNDNDLTQLPVNLPPHLEQLDLGNNRLTALTTNLPQSLVELNVNVNQITEIPESMTRLPPTLRISVARNPLSDRTLRLLSTLNNRNYRSPQFFFSMLDHGASQRVRPLHDAIASWVDPTQAARWNLLSKEANQDSFSQFLDRLAMTQSVNNNADFKQRIAVWLSQLADTPELRQKTFAIAQGATETCEDRVTCTFNNMQQARVVHDVENGIYDQNLSALVSLGREMYRLAQLEKFARDKVKTLRSVDEIEVYLAYQVKLRDSLKLTTVAPEMRYFEVSYVTQNDLNTAITQVKKSENDEFATWFTQWSPWQSTLQRKDPAQYTNALAERDALVTDGTFDKRVDKKLEEEGLPDDIETRSAIGKTVMDQINQETYHHLTEHELGKTKSRHLLHRVWSDQGQ